MKVRARAIPGHEARVRLHQVGTADAGGTVHLVVDAAAVARGPMVRTAAPAFMEDSAGPVPRRVTDQAEQRRGFPSALDGPDSLLARFRRSRPGLTPVAVTGCGNLGMNAGVRAVVDGRALGTSGPEGATIIVAEGRKGRLAVPGEAPGPGTFSISGPLLVREGRPAPLRAETFADPRHLLLFPFVRVGQVERVDFGLTRLLRDLDLYQCAVDGQAVRLVLAEELPDTDALEAPMIPHEVDREALTAALETKGYGPADRVTARGTYRFVDDALEIAYQRGIYPHHVLALDADGAVHSILITGISNRVGVHLDELAEDLAHAGFATAVLMDNGGDVGLWLPREDRFAVRPAEPDRASRWPLTACFVYAMPG